MEKRQGTKVIGNDFKFLSSGGYKTEIDEGVIVANCLIGNVVGVERYNDIVMKVRFGRKYLAIVHRLVDQ